MSTCHFCRSGLYRSYVPRHISLRSFAVFCGWCFYFMYFGAVDLSKIRYAVILTWFCPCFRGLFWPILYFLCQTSTWHLDSCPPEDTWYGVILWVLRVLGQGLNQRARIFFIRAFSGCYSLLKPQKGRNSCLWLQSRSVLSSFGVVLMHCKVNFTWYDQHCSILLAEFNVSTFNYDMLWQ